MKGKCAYVFLKVERDVTAVSFLSPAQMQYTTRILIPPDKDVL